MARVLCLGEALIDFSPAPSPSEGGARMFVQHAGGAPANVAVAVARLGGDAEFAGMLGADMFGEFLLQSLRDAGVGVRFVARTAAAPTALAFVALDSQGERSFSFYRPPAADLLLRDADLPDDAFANTAILHACSNSLTEAAIAQTTFAAMRRARAAGALVSFDMNLRPMLWARDVDPAERLREALALADLVKLSREEFEFLAARDGGDEAARRRLWQANCRLLVVTDGARALRWFTPDRSGVVPTLEVVTVDSTAAGDAFTGGLLHGLVELGIDRDALPRFANDDGERDGALRFAAACGAWAATRPGAFAAMPTAGEVAQLIASARAAAQASAA